VSSSALCLLPRRSCSLDYCAQLTPLAQIWELKTDKPIELNVGAATKKVVQSTRSLAAAAGPQKVKAPTTQPGVRMPKPKYVVV